MPLNYEIHGCLVEVADGGRTATARRLEIRSADGKGVIRSAAKADFETVVEKLDDVETSICAQEQAHLWARALPEVIEQEPGRPAKDAHDGE